jgi:hypothetical protein
MAVDHSQVTVDKAEAEVNVDVEAAPAANQQPNTDNEKPYSIYSKKQMIAIILGASIASFFSPMSANIYLPAINSIAADLHVSSTMINLTLTSYLVSTTPLTLSQAYL